jgi:hypothetical protein
VWPPPLTHANGTRLCCINDGEPIDGIPFPIPYSFNREQQKYNVAMMTCGPACAKRWIYDRQHLNGTPSLHLIDKMARDVFGMQSDTEMAPSTLVLDKNGGTMPLLMYRSYGLQFNAAKINALASHLSPHHIIMDIQEKAITSDREQINTVTRVHFPPDAVQDNPSRVMWNSEVLQRPSHLPDDPVLPDDDEPTIFDRYVANHGAEISMSSKRKKASKVSTAVAAAAEKGTVKRGGGRRKKTVGNADIDQQKGKKPRGRRAKQALHTNEETTSPALVEVQQSAEHTLTDRLSIESIRIADESMVIARPLKKRRVIADGVVSLENTAVNVKKKKKQKNTRDPKKRKRGDVESTQDGQALQTATHSNKSASESTVVIEECVSHAHSQTQNAPPTAFDILLERLPPCSLSEDRPCARIEQHHKSVGQITQEPLPSVEQPQRKKRRTAKTKKAT